MIDPSSARMLAEIASRAQEMLGAYTPGAATKFADVAPQAAQPRHVSDPLSVSSSDGYFVVSDRGRRLFTKAGTFEVHDGALTQDGKPVFGFADAQARRQGVLSSLRIDPVDAALQRYNDLRIEPDGQVAYTRGVRDGTTGHTRPERVAVGTLALARFPAGTQLPQVDTTHFGAPPGIAAQLGAPADGSFAPLATQSRARAAFDLDAALLRLHEAYQAFDAFQAAKSARGSTDKTAMDLLK